jgi:uncharacterized protein
MSASLFRPENLKVTYRKMKFPFERTGFKPHWHRGSPFISHFWNALSQAFMPGEKFFIDSVRSLRELIEDPELLEEMEEFVRQEAHHTLQHRKFNRMLADQGYDTDRLERRYEWAPDVARKFSSPMGMLEVTMALEHFTSGFAHQYFENPEIGRGADPNVEALWAWHAAEEAEHKATAFDVHQRLGGSYLGRVARLGPSWGAIVAITLVNVLDLMRQDGRLGDRKDIQEGMAYLFGRRGLFTSMIPSFLAYLNPRFHPWQEDDSAEIAKWEAGATDYLQQKGRTVRRAAVPSATASAGAAAAAMA